MGVDSTTVSGLLKEVYSDDKVENIQNMETETWGTIKKSSKKPSGSGFFGPVNLKGNQRGQGAQNELEALRTPGAQAPQQFRVLPKVLTHTIRYSGLSMEIAEGNEDSFAENTTFQVEEGMADFAKEHNAELFRDGSGKIGQVNGTVSGSATVTLDNTVMPHFREGMYVDAINGSSVKQIDSIEVTAVDITNNQITLGSAQSCDDDSWIYREDTADNAPTDGKELAGFPLLSDDGSILTTFENISRSTYPRWDGINISGGSANVSNDFLVRMRSQAKVIGGKKMKKICSNTSQMRKYLNIIVPAITFEKGKDLDSQRDPMPTWNGMEWMEDSDCAFDEIYMYDPAAINRYVVRDIHVDDRDGKTVKWSSGFDAYVTILKSYQNIGISNPKCMVRAHTLATPTF